MEDDIDIYEDLPTFGTEHGGNFVSNSQENIVEEELKLKKQIADLTVKLDNFQKINQSLEINLHSLLKTAKAEIARKDKMIDELRKNLDDIAFKRSKINDSVSQKSTNRETTLNRHRKQANICFAPEVNDTETLVIDALCNRASKIQPNKSTLMPITVFGERLVKRIAEDQNLEKEEKQSNKFAGGNNDCEINDGYIVESDKENGSLNGTVNICNTKEINSPVSSEHKGGEHTKCPLAVSTVTTKDIQSNGKNETGSKVQRKSVLTRACTGKRANEDTDEHLPTKQLKSSNEKYFSESSRQDTNIAFESEKKSLLSVYANVGTAPRVNERHPLRNSDTVRSGNSGNSGTELEKHEHHLYDTHKKEDTKDLKNKNNLSYDNKKDTDKRSPQRCKKNSVQNLLKFTLDERYAGYRCSDVFKKGDYQSNHSEYYRSRRREHHRTDDHRSSRVKPTSHGKSSREERYARSQYNKHSNYEEKFEKHYNFRNSNSKDKLKHFKKDSYNARSVIKHSTTDRISNVAIENVANVKRNNGQNEHESRKVTRLKGTDKPTAKWETKQNESCQKYLEFSKRIENIGEKTVDQVVGNIDRIAEREREVQVDDELRKYGKEEGLENRSIDLEDGEISTTRNGSPTENLDRELNCSSASGNNLYSMTSSKNDLIVKPKSFDTVSQTASVSTIANATSVSADRKGSASTESIESIENVENIEKFIRDYGFNGDKTVQAVSNNSLANASVGKEDEGRNCEKNSNDSRASSRNTNDATVSLDENHRTTSGENVRTSRDDSPRDSPRFERDDKRNDKLNDPTTENDRRESSRKMKVEQKSVSRCIGKQVEKVEDFKKPLENRSDKNTKVASTNIHGKIVVFARRKKPVCLTNSNANMIVVVSNGRTDIGCDSSNTNGASTECDSVPKLVKTSGYDATNAS